MNAAGCVVGAVRPSAGAPYRAVAWLPDPAAPDGYTAISLHPEQGWVLTRAMGINDSDLVVGYGHHASTGGLYYTLLWQIANGSAQLVKVLDGVLSPG